MKYVVYVSQAKTPFSDTALAELLAKSRARNTDDGVTGLLLYRYSEDFDKGYFIQAIEGPEVSIEALWNRIRGDSRHHSIITLSEGEKDSRMFPSWTMGFKNVDASELARLPGFTQIDTDSFWQNLKANSLPDAVDLLQSFYEAG